MTWDAFRWDEATWDPETPSPPPLDYFHRKPKPKSTTDSTSMKRQDYYPTRIAAQATWLDNYATKLASHASALGLVAAEVTASVNDARYARYVLGSWLSAVRAFTPSTTDAVDDVLTGTGTTAMVLPVFTSPLLPEGVTPALPGTLTRIFALVAKLKLAPGYTEAIGTDLGVVGTPSADKQMPKFLTELVQGATCQCVKITFYKYGHMGVYIESRRGSTGTWEFLAIDTESPYLDERPLATAGAPEVREYRLRFWDKGTPNGDWTPHTKLTVSQ